MDIKKLQTLVVDALEDVKGQDIAVFETSHLTSLFDRIAIVSGTSNRQTKALAASVRDKVKDAGGQIIGMEGEETGEWVLVDLGDMIVHIMQAPIRAYYRLEEIWGDTPIKLGAAKRAPKKAGDDEPKKISGHLAASKAKVEVSPVIEKKTPAKKATAATAAKKAPAKKAASKAVGKTVKIAPTKTEAAAVKALKALPEKKVRTPRAAKPAADAAPAKTVIKRIKKVEA
ncbi:ribosome-associated protein [Janthinobacterium sp. 35]|jgi:ribosome-associated protein|uniref:Ribosomal silencing factor RsfS n=1 Tax=Janthinobacterium lividum TaxID=29581 RepID=A0A1S1UF30_9BURK|nr:MULTISPECIES: ribosome silencing factor [Janthinobacterium]MDI3293267.1 ribosome silencing factor [Janthinobacterium tructae]OHV98494.1 iojap family protein [Janthinobacterium lividum]PIG29018.1 ribosome-associated protein [Janthinobacterium sp. 35]PVX38123.1 ribosome-associated protein [Janthinobacterium sp. 78]